MPKIPTSPAYARVKIWRRLQAIGAVMIKNSVYVLPNREECVEAFQWLTKELGELGGQASLCEGTFFDGVTDEEIERSFSEARDADYAELAEEARNVAKLFKPRRSANDNVAALETQVTKLRKRLDEVVAIDFFRAAGRESAEGLVISLTARLNAVRSPPSPKRGGSEATARPRNRTWVTRTGVHVDRIASAWLIRRFIDPEATFKFVAPKGYAPEAGELRFDMYEAEYTHDGDRCSFEVLLERLGVDDAALRPIAEIVHDIDLRDEKFGREETAGVRSGITGICVANRDDLARIAAGSTLFDALYAYFSLRSSGKKGEASK
jgi:hypothetical protein